MSEDTQGEGEASSWHMVAPSKYLLNWMSSKFRQQSGFIYRCLRRGIEWGAQLQLAVIFTIIGLFIRKVNSGVQTLDLNSWSALCLLPNLVQIPTPFIETVSSSVKWRKESPNIQH